MSFSPLITQLISAFRSLPGVGQKSAQRMAFYLLNQHREEGLFLSSILEKALNNVSYCKSCRTFCESTFCNICQNANRNNTQLCIVESPLNILSLEQTSHYSGKYFVLHGHISPLDGIGPEEIGLGLLEKRIKGSELKEIILALNPTVEGQATTQFICDFVKPYGIKISRIAQGVPQGVELEYLDANTLSQALHDRSIIEP